VGVRGDLVYVQQAVNNRWLTNELKPMAMDAVVRGLQSGDPRAELRAAEIVIAMERQNQVDEQSESKQLLKRVLDQLAEYGISAASLGVGETTSSGAIESYSEDNNEEDDTGH
jgi:hypothetical protein